MICSNKILHFKDVSVMQVLYTVPECVGHKCSCATAKTALPIPKVEAIQTKKAVIINWNIASNNSDINSYVIR
jgi:hypothetical protein